MGIKGGLIWLMNLWQNKFDKCGKILIGIVYIIPTGGSVVLTDHICKIIINGGDCLFGLFWHE